MVDEGKFSELVNNPPAGGLLTGVENSVAEMLPRFFPT
jgi:hypothetical protein